MPSSTPFELGLWPTLAIMGKFSDFMGQGLKKIKNYQVGILEFKNKFILKTSELVFSFIFPICLVNMTRADS